MIHKFVLGRCVQCNIPQENLEHLGWECSGHNAPVTARVSRPIPNQTTDIFAILAFATGLVGLCIWPIILTPICCITSIISYHRLRENPNLKGKGLRLAGAILGIIEILYMVHVFRIID